MRYSLRAKAKPAGFYNEDINPLKPEKVTGRITKKATAAKKAVVAKALKVGMTARAAKVAKAKPKDDNIPKDLDKSYVEIWKPEVLPRPKKQSWKHEGDESITDMKNVPPGWSSHDPDLDPNDIDRQIKRCHERIEANIMPAIFEKRLKKYLKMMADRDEMMEEEADDLSWDVVQRLDDLEHIRGWLEDDDDDEQLVSVDALMKAYTIGDLEWNAGLVTYWSKGKQLCQPRPFQWSEFLAISTKHKGHVGFWVEGVSYLRHLIRKEHTNESRLLQGPKAGKIHLKEITPNSGTLNGANIDSNSLLSPTSPAVGPTSHIEIRLNDTVQSHPFSYVKDSGAHIMTITDRDFAYLHKVSVTSDGFDPKPAACMGVTRVHLGTGEEASWRSKALQIKFKDPDHPKRGDWEWVQCHLREERHMGSNHVPGSGTCVLYRDTLLWKYGPREGINRKPQVLG
ncbi:uncharacterized protein N7511_003866 [Penicillium nucicola]|uniref:uncharacterized protein n=1 Tax=Penicillium nucicola TaxID=1850975 RepID=UPI00254572D6|nr:uncharacterized protein N7511_003866 [Penicillium nucicola]KAJ5766250.1 hypothetical protein N7511_003866 [Penicillium nucicola]